MNSRPRLNLTFTTTDYILEVIGWLTLIAIWFWVFVNYQDLPSIIPTHFNGAGNVDGTGPKSTIIWLPIVASILFIGQTVLNKFPHLFNYLSEITEENAEAHYQLSTRLMRYLKLFINILFFAITFETIYVALHHKNIFGFWFLPATFLLTFVPIIIYLIQASKIE